MRFRTYTQRACRSCPGQRPRGTVLRRAGIVLMAIGALFLLIFVPLRVWLALLGLLMLVFGFILFWLG